MDKSKLAAQKAFDLLGGTTAAASALGTYKQKIHYWLSEHGRVPAEICPSIERLTDRKVKCEQLRPDVDWAYLREHAK